MRRINWKITIGLIVAIIFMGYISYGIHFFTKSEPEQMSSLEYQTPHLSSPSKRIAVFASYSPNGHIADYVIHYLKSLKEANVNIIFISDNSIFPSEINKIKDLVLYAKFERHGEYDFGSYKRGLQYLLEHDLINPQTHLILCNDSVYGPFYPFSQIFEKMDLNTIDFWGMTANVELEPHLQSYFLYFKNERLIKKDLFTFLSQVKPQATGWQVVLNYEIKLTKYLQDQGYQVASFIPVKEANAKAHTADPTFGWPLELIKDDGFPFVKRKFLRLEKSEITSPVLYYIEGNFPTVYRLIISDLYL